MPPRTPPAPVRTHFPPQRPQRSRPAATLVPAGPRPAGKAYALPDGWPVDALHVARWRGQKATVLYGPFDTLQSALDAYHAVRGGLGADEELLVNGLDCEGLGDTWDNTLDAWEPGPGDVNAAHCRMGWERAREQHRDLCASEARGLYPFH